MTWLNEGEIDEAERRVDPEAQPNLTRAVLAVSALRGWTNSHSDGWPYWQKPSRAAAKLQALIYDYVILGRSEDITEAALKRALTPVKAFLTRQEVPHEGIIH